MALDMSHLQQWVGKSEVLVERLAAFPSMALAATLDRAVTQFPDGAVLPALWHWLHFLPITAMAQTGTDGHPLRGGFLPPVPLPRRMWAGGRLQFHHPLRIGETVERHSRVLRVDYKPGRSGDLVFVQVGHELHSSLGIAVREEHDIVYRQAATSTDLVPAVTMAPLTSRWERPFKLGAVELFRYSALTFNSHRIHYDRSYACNVEHYPGLVVHGPLIATLLMELLASSCAHRTVGSFSFRALKPLFDGQAFSVCGTLEGDGSTASLWTRDDEGAMTMQATATLG
ncbi:MAG: FAS1-like dehydratase domain-containing protein [Janthinobacterium lividum]